MSKKGMEWTPKQVEVTELLQSGADPQAVIAKGFSKTMVLRVANAIKAEFKQRGNRNRNRGVALEVKIWLTTRSQNDEKCNADFLARLLYTIVKVVWAERAQAYFWLSQSVLIWLDHRNE